VSDDWMERHTKMKERDLEIDQARVDLKEREERIDAAKAARLAESADVAELAKSGREQAVRRRRSATLRRLGALTVASGLGAPAALHLGSVPFTVALCIGAFVGMVTVAVVALSRGREK